ncbi:MAG: hypothetical protein ACLU9V_05920 [Roseburia sp.]
MDISVQETKLTGGDFVVMVTDGVLEYLHVKKTGGYHAGDHREHTDQ